MGEAKNRADADRAIRQAIFNWHVTRALGFLKALGFFFVCAAVFIVGTDVELWVRRCDAEQWNCVLRGAFMWGVYMPASMGAVVFFVMGLDAMDKVKRLRKDIENMEFRHRQTLVSPHERAKGDQNDQ